MVRVRSARALPVLGAAILLGGCAALADRPDSVAAFPDGEPVPAVLVGVPPSVIVDRALVDLDSGDAFRVERARAVLLALPVEDVEAIRRRARSGEHGSGRRLSALAILAERGEPLDDWAASEIVEMTLREIEGAEPGGRAAILGLERLRAMGDSARGALRAVGGPGEPRAALAERLLRLLGPARELPEPRP